jgi:CheY-like chemotaxis protein
VSTISIDEPAVIDALVVDDNADSAAALKMMLRILGYDAEIAHDGTDVLRKATGLNPRLVLLDICMPKLDGYDTCGVLRAQPWGKDVRIVAITGQEKVEIENRSHKVGFDAYILKPVELELLREVVGEA